MNIVEYEAHMDEYEEMHRLMQELAAAEVAVGDAVVCDDPATQALFGKGVHDVVAVDETHVTAFNGYRNFRLPKDEFRKVEASDLL